MVQPPRSLPSSFAQQEKTAPAPSKASGRYWNRKCMCMPIHVCDPWHTYFRPVLCPSVPEAVSLCRGAHRAPGLQRGCARDPQTWFCSPPGRGLPSSSSGLQGRCCYSLAPPERVGREVAFLVHITKHHWSCLLRSCHF